MRKILIAIVTMLTLNVAFADSHVCSFRPSEGNSYRITFKFNEGIARDQVLVTIHLNNRIQISHLNKVIVDSDSHGDGWSMKLRDSGHRQYKYDLVFEAQYVNSAYVTMPGLRDFRVDSCRRIRN